MDRDWTGNPISVQRLSRPCPMSVHVQGLSICCPTEVRCLSGPCPNHLPLDRDWTRKSSVCQDLGSSNPTINSLLDKVWTNSGCGQTLDISSIFNHLSQHPEFVQTLSSRKTLLRIELSFMLDPNWTYVGHGPSPTARPRHTQCSIFAHLWHT